MKATQLKEMDQTLAPPGFAGATGSGGCGGGHSLRSSHAASGTHSASIEDGLRIRDVLLALPCMLIEVITRRPRKSTARQAWRRGAIYFGGRLAGA